MFNKKVKNYRAVELKTPGIIERTLTQKSFINDNGEIIVMQRSLTCLAMFQVVLASSIFLFLPSLEDLAVIDKTSQAFSDVFSIANALSLTEGPFNLHQLFVEWKVSGRIGENIDYHTFCTQLESSRKAYCARLLADGQLTVYSYFYTYSILNFTQLAPMHIIAQTFTWHCVQEVYMASGNSETFRTMYEMLRLFTGDNVGCSLSEFAKLVCDSFETWVRFIADTKGAQEALTTLNNGLDVLEGLGIPQDLLDALTKKLKGIIDS